MRALRGEEDGKLCIAVHVFIWDESICNILLSIEPCMCGGIVGKL